MILGQAVDAVSGNDVGKALVVEGQGIDNRFGKDDGGRSLDRLAVDDPGTGTGKVQVADAAFRIDVSAVEIDDSSVLSIDRKDNAVVEDLIAFGVEDAKVFQGFDYFRILGQDVFEAAVDKACAEVGEGLVVLYSSAFQVFQALWVFCEGVLVVADHPGQ